MSLSLAMTALLMGLAGGPHCTAMCGAACAGVARASGRRTLAPWIFQAGRVSGYAGSGALAAEATQGLAWLAQQTAALRPVWTLFHVAVLAWGLMLLALARQPAWVSDAGRTVWAKARPAVGARGGLFAAGALWTLMPCGLLYSALLVASLNATAFGGALSMVLFAVGSGIWLVAAPRLVAVLHERAGRLRSGLGVRVTGFLLAASAVFAIWVDLAHRIAQWCA